MKGHPRDVLLGCIEFYEGGVFSEIPNLHGLTRIKKRTMKIITHENLWWWGKSITLIADDGKAMVEVLIEDERPDAGCIQSLMVHESVRQRGIANAMMTFAEEKAKKAGCDKVYLGARKGTFLIPWYERRGYKIYDENPEYSKGQTVSMSKHF